MIKKKNKRIRTGKKKSTVAMQCTAKKNAIALGRGNEKGERQLKKKKQQAKGLGLRSGDLKQAVGGGGKGPHGMDTGPANPKKVSWVKLELLWHSKRQEEKGPNGDNKKGN